MSANKKCIVIHSGSNSTVAGFSNVDLPKCVIPSSYIKFQSKPDEYVFGLFEMLEVANDAKAKSDAEVYTIIDENGIPYNWEALEKQWRYIFEKQLKCNPSEYPLLITVPTIKDELSTYIVEKYMDLAFNKFNIPVLQIIIEPLSIALAMGKNSALVVDIGSHGCNVTPVFDGTVIKNSIMKSKFGGDFLDYQISELFKGKLTQDKEGDTVNMEDGSTKRSIDIWLESNTWIKDFKVNMLEVSDRNLIEIEKYYQEQSDMYIQQQTELQKYNNNKMNMDAITSVSKNNNPLNQKKNYLFKNMTEKTTMQFENRECYKIPEYLFQPEMLSEKFSNADGLGELISKSIKKAGASISSMSNNVVNNIGPSMTLTKKNSTTIGAMINGGPNNKNNNITTTTSSTSTMTPEQIYSLLLTNVIITGSTSLLDGMEQRIIKELSIRFPQYKLVTFANQIVMDRKVQGYIGAVTMANLPSWELGKWFTKEDYENLDKTKQQQQQQQS